MFNPETLVILLLLLLFIITGCLSSNTHVEKAKKFSPELMDLSLRLVFSIPGSKSSSIQHQGKESQK